VTPSVRAARALLGWSERRLAKAARVHHNTVNNFEVGRYAGTPATLAAIRRALEKAGVEFTNGKKSGVRLKVG
jgi:ribosome-binding protein aMBF1 (putative translation factor)